MKPANSGLILITTLALIAPWTAPAAQSPAREQMIERLEKAMERYVGEFEAQLDRGGEEARNAIRSESYINLMAARSIHEELVEHPGESNDLIGDVDVSDPAKLDAWINQLIKETASAMNPGLKPSATSSGQTSGYDWPAGTWSLTFDDGPRVASTPKFLEFLEKSGTPATFFMLTSLAHANSSLVQKILSAGHEVASHSYTHANLSKASANLAHEIDNAIVGLEKHTNGRPVTSFRLPYGAGSSLSRVRSRIAAQGAIHILWTVDTLDWMYKTNPAKIIEISKKQINAHKGGIVLFHDIHTSSIGPAKAVQDYLLSKKATLCTVARVIDQINGKTVGCR